MYQIQQHPVPNHGTRGSYKPIAIVDHITIGSMQSVINTFSRPGGNSSHYLVCRDGLIIQLVDLTRRAHTNGIVNTPKSALVRQMGNVNANYYTVTIEHEGYEIRDKVTGKVLEDHGVDGTLTEEQFQATVWLHKWIQTEVERLFKVRIPLNSHQVIAHHQIDSKKGTCPGVNFPWVRLYAELARIDHMTLTEYEEDAMYRRTINSLTADAYAFLSRIKGLRDTRKDPKYGKEADRKIMLMAPVMPQMGLQGEATVDGILKRIEEVEAAAISDGRWRPEGVRKLNIGIQHAKNVGLIA